MGRDAGARGHRAARLTDARVEGARPTDESMEQDFEIPASSRLSRRTFSYHRVTRVGARIGRGQSQRLHERLDLLAVRLALGVRVHSTSGGRLFHDREPLPPPSPSPIVVVPPPPPPAHAVTRASVGSSGARGVEHEPRPDAVEPGCARLHDPTRAVRGVHEAAPPGSARRRRAPALRRARRRNRHARRRTGIPLMMRRRAAAAANLVESAPVS